MPAPEREPRMGPLPAPIGVPLSWLYRAVIGRINRRFDRRRGIVTFDRPVISIGNLSVGGTGKTPMVKQVVNWLLEAGHRPCIAMRGYGKARRHGESDEASEYLREFSDVPVVARSNRTLGLIQLFADEHDRSEQDGPSESHTDCIVLDDGFQHRQIARQLDIVLIDASRDPFLDRLLPAGWLREPVSSLSRASAIVLTHAECVSDADITSLDQRIAQSHGHRAAAVCGHQWKELAIRRGQVDESLPVSWLKGKRIVAVCAIGNPGPFIAAAERAGVLTDRVVLRDHDPYSKETVNRIMGVARAARADAIVTTEKDWSKLGRIADDRWPCAVVRPRLELTFDRGEEAFRAMILEAAGRVVADEDGQGQVMAKV